MKKLLAILLIVAMLIPMGITAQAETVEKKPFVLTNWGYFEHIDPEVKDSLTNVYYMPYYWTNGPKLKQGVTYVYARDLEVDTIEGIARETKALFDTYPEGARYINFTLPATAIGELAEICFADKAIPVVSQWLDKFLKEYKSIGGKLDGLTVDVEYLDIYSNYIHDNYYIKDKLVYDTIVNHPTYEEKIRPMLVERGFKFYSPATEDTPEIYGIYPKSPSEYTQSRAIWNQVMRSYLNQVVNECCAPLWDYYPDAVVSDYTSKNAKPWIKELDDSGSVNAGSGGSLFTAGNSNNDNFYGVRPKTTFFTNSSNGPAYPTLPGYNDTVFTNTKFNRFLFEMNVAKNTYLASDNGNVSWWLAPAYYNSTTHNAYFAELMLHLCLLNPQAILGYILAQDCVTDGKRDIEKYENALKIADQCLRMASNVAGYADRKAINVEHNWNYPFVLSGMYANGRNVYRITPDTDVVSLKDFQVNDAKDITFTADGITVTFPGGKIIADSAVYDIGTCGYWVETAKDVTPIITKSENYYYEYAAYQETYDDFEIGMEYNYNNAKPTACWEPKKQGAASATIVADPTDANKKMLAVTGNYNFKNVEMPGNVIGADTYAKHQAWEISFILPADLAADAELQLLNTVPKTKKAKDQGIKIAGGKVYYDQAGKYVEMEGVTLTSGVKYTVVREMNFTTKDAYTCDYYVYGADGTVVGSAKKVPTAQMDTPIYAISFATKGVTGEPVLFDNYKLYTTKVNTDFYLYDAKTGVPVAEMDKPREAATAYRFAWLNSTVTEKSYTIMAAYYDGETKVSEEVVKEVKMAPGFNGVEFGEFENKQAGKTMLIYIRDNNPPEPEEVVTPGGNEEKPPVDDDNNKTEGPDTTTIIIIAAAAAAVVVAVVVIVLVASAKKKKKAAAAKAEETTEETTDESTEE